MSRASSSSQRASSGDVAYALVRTPHRLNQDFADRLAVVDLQALAAGHVETLQVDSKLMKHCRVDIRHIVRTNTSVRMGSEPILIQCGRRNPPCPKGWTSSDAILRLECE